MRTWPDDLFTHTIHMGACRLAFIFMNKIKYISEILPVYLYQDDVQEPWPKSDEGALLYR